MENNCSSAPTQREAELEHRADRAEIKLGVYEEVFKRQRAGILELQRQIAALQQRITYLETGGEGYQDKSWIEKVVQCIADAGEPLTAAELLQHLEQRDRGRLCQLKDPRKMLSVVLSRGVKANRLYKDGSVEVAKAVYSVW